MPKATKSKKSKDKVVDVGVLQISDIAPLARRNKKEEKEHEKLQRFTKELDKDAWVKAVKLMKGQWTPFPKYHRCYKSKAANKLWGVGVNQDLVIQFKKAVLAQNWSNAVKLAIVIFKNFSTFNERIHLQTFLSVLMGHPRAGGTFLSNACSFLWKVERKEDMAELLRCFCSMPKKLPAEFLNQVKNRAVYVRSKRDLRDKKKLIELQYTAHIGKSSDNDMYVE